MEIDMTDPLPTDNKRIVFTSRPQGSPTPENFRLEHAPLPVPGALPEFDEPGLRVVAAAISASSACGSRLARYA